MRVDESDGCGRVSPASFFVCGEGTRKMEKKSVGWRGERFLQPSSGCGVVIHKRWSKIERKGVKRMIGEVDGGVRKKV